MTPYEMYHKEEMNHWHILRHALQEETSPLTWMSYVSQGFQTGLMSLSKSPPLNTSKDSLTDTHLPFYRYATQLYQTHRTSSLTHEHSENLMCSKTYETLHPLYAQKNSLLTGSHLIWMPTRLYQQTHLGPLLESFHKESLSSPTLTSFLSHTLEETWKLWMSKSFSKHTPNPFYSKKKENERYTQWKKVRHSLKKGLCLTVTSPYNTFSLQNKNIFLKEKSRTFNAQSLTTSMNLQSHKVSFLEETRLPLQPGLKEYTSLGGFFYHAYSQTGSYSLAPTLTRCSLNHTPFVYTPSDKSEEDFTGPTPIALDPQRRYYKAHHPYGTVSSYGRTPYDASPAYAECVTPSTLYFSPTYILYWSTYKVTYCVSEHTEYVSTRTHNVCN